MIRKIIYAIGMFLFIGLWINGAGELSIAGEVGDESVKARSSFNQNAADRRQLPVLSISPREIDLGTIKQDEVSFGEFVLRNVAPGPSEDIVWQASCPEGWSAESGKTIEGKVTRNPDYMRVDVYSRDNNENYFWEQPRISSYRIHIKMEVGSRQIVCARNMKPGTHRLPIKLTSTGGQRTVFIVFSLLSMQEPPSIVLSPQRLDLGIEMPGKTISQRIEVTNPGTEILKWSVFVPQPGMIEYTRELAKERYYSFYNPDVADGAKYLPPGHLKDTLELVGKWVGKNGYPVSAGTAGAIKFHFQGTGVSFYLKQPSGEESSACYLDDERIYLGETVPGREDQSELVTIRGLADTSHNISIVVKQGTLEPEGVKIFGREIKRGPKGWITVYPVSGTTGNEIDYVNVKVDTSYLNPGNYGEQITFKTNVGNKVAEVYIDVASDSMPKVIDIYLYTKNNDYLFTADPQGEARRLIQYGYVKQGIAFRLFPPQTAGTTPFHRWFHPGNNDHYYHHEREGGGKKLDEYVYEGVIGNIATSRLTNTRALYRWFNPTTKTHYYSTETAQATSSRKGYRFEGIAGYVR